jgi:hypothetical protein
MQFEVTPPLRKGAFIIIEQSIIPFEEAFMCRMSGRGISH